MRHCSLAISQMQALLNCVTVQGENIRSHMRNIPRTSDPIPLIHVYVDLHLMTLHKAGVIPRLETDNTMKDPGAVRHATYHASELTLMADTVHHVHAYFVRMQFTNTNLDI